MNWLGSFSPFSLRLCTVLLNRYLSPYLDIPLDDSQINYDHSRSQALCSNLSLNVEKINAHLQVADVPFTVCVAYIEKIVINHPFSGISGGETLGIEVHGLEVEFKPKHQGHLPPTDDMLQSMVTSVMSGIPDTMEQSILDTFQSSNVRATLPNQDIVGGLMNVIYGRLCNASLSLFNTLIRLEYCPQGGTRGMGLQLTIACLEIVGSQSKIDENESSPSHFDPNLRPVHLSTNISTDHRFGTNVSPKNNNSTFTFTPSSINQVTKQIHISDIQLNWDVFTITADEDAANVMSQSCTLSDSMTESCVMDNSSFSSISHRQLAQAASRQKTIDLVTPPVESDLTTVLMLSIPGRCTAELFICTSVLNLSTTAQPNTAYKPGDLRNPTDPGIHLNLQFPAIHMLLAPEQVHWILNLCEELNNRPSVAPPVTKSSCGKPGHDPYRGNTPLQPEEIQRWKLNDSRSCDSIEQYADSVYFKSCISYANDPHMSSDLLNEELIQSELFTSAIADHSNSVDEHSTLASLQEAAMGRFVTSSSNQRKFVSQKNSSSELPSAISCKGAQCLADIGIKIEFFSLILLHRQPRASRPDPCSDLLLQQEALQQQREQQGNVGMSPTDNQFIDPPVINKALQQAQVDSVELSKLAERHFSLLRQLKTTPTAYADQLAAYPTSSSRLHFLRLVRANLIELCEMDHLSLLVHNICFNARRESSTLKVTNIYELTLGNPLLSEILYFKNAAHDLRGLMANLYSRRPVDIHEIISFPDSGSCHEENPCLRIHIQANTPTGNGICKPVEGLSSNIPISCGPENGFELRCTLASCEIRLDITVIDRLQHILSYPYMSRRNKSKPTPHYYLNDVLPSPCTSPLPRSCSMMDSMYVDLNSPEDDNFSANYNVRGQSVLNSALPTALNVSSKSRSTISLYLSCPGCVKVHLFIPLPRATTSSNNSGNMSGPSTANAAVLNTTVTSVPGCSPKSPCTWKRYVCSDWFRLDFTKPSLCSTFISTDVKSTFELSSEQILVSLCQPEQVEPIKLLLALPNISSPEVILPSISVVLQPPTKRFESNSMGGDNSCDLSQQLNAATSDYSWPMGGDATKSDGCTQDHRPLPLRFEHSYSHNSTFGHLGDNKSYYRPSDAEEMKRYHNMAKDITELSISLQLPYLLIQLQSKSILDNAYERLGCELPVWKPAVFALKDSLLPLNPPWLLGCYPSHCILHHDQFVICPWANVSLKVPQRTTSTSGNHFLSSHTEAAEFQDFPDLGDRVIFGSGDSTSMDEDYDSTNDEEEEYENSECNAGMATPTGPSVLRSSSLCISISIHRGYVSALVPLHSSDVKKGENPTETYPMDLPMRESANPSNRKSSSLPDPPLSKNVQVGKFHFRLNQAHIFFESGHNGDPTLAYLTVNLERASVYHKGSMVAPTLTDLDEPQNIIERPPSDVLITLLPIPNGIQPCFSQPLSGLNMLILVMQFKDYPPLSPSKKSNISKLPSASRKKSKPSERSYQTGPSSSSTPMKAVNSIRPHQDVVVSLTIQESLLLGRIVKSEEFWVNQLIDWFQFPVVELPGYTLPTSSTKLCINFVRIAANYSCSDLSYYGLLTSEDVTISTHILSDSLTSLLEITLDGVGLFVAPSLSPKEMSRRDNTVVRSNSGGAPRVVNTFTLHEALIRNVRTHFVPVLDLTQLELSISVNPLHVKTYPLIDIRCTNQNLSFHSCADSCVAVITLLRHITAELNRGNSTVASQDSTNQSTSAFTSMQSNNPMSFMSTTQTGDDGQSSLKMVPTDARQEEFQSVMQDALMEPLQKIRTERGAHLNEDNKGSERDSNEAPVIPSPWNDFEIIQRETVPSPGEVVRCLLENPNEPIPWKDNHFKEVLLHHHRKSPFCEPKRYPQAELAVTLHDISLVWKFFAGCDFSSSRSLDALYQTQAKSSNVSVKVTADVPIPTSTTHMDAQSGSVSGRLSTTHPMRRTTQHNPPYLAMSSAVDIRPSSSWERERMPVPPYSPMAATMISNPSFGNGSSLRSVNSEVSLFSMNSSTTRMRNRLSIPPALNANKTCSAVDMTGYSTSTSNKKSATRKKQEWWKQGGSGRDQERAIELKLCKLHFRYATFSMKSRFSYRCVLTIQRLEVMDLVKSSEFDKLLYQHSSEDMPFDDNAPFFRLKLLVQKAGVFSRSDSSTMTDGDDSLEMEIKSSLQPLRIRLDQDTIEMIEEYFSRIIEELKNVELRDKPVGAIKFGSQHSGMNLSRPSSSCSRESLSSRSPYHEEAVLSVDLVKQEVVPRTSSQGRDMSSSGNLENSEDTALCIQKGAVFDELSSHTDPTEEESQSQIMNSTESSSSTDAPTGSSSPKRIYIRRFTFSPDVPILLDYRGKRINMTHGALAGVLKCLAEFNKSYIVIHNLKYERGLKDIYRLVDVIVEDLQADLSKQWPGLLSGLGPMHEIIQIFSGLRDLVWMPVESYREDGSVLRGIKKGTRSFYSSAVTSTLELLWRGLNICHNVSAVSHDLLTPGQSLRSRRPRLRQPADLREGCSNAAATVTRGIINLREDFALAISNGQLSGKGAAGTAGEILRQIPSAFIAPIAVGTEATGHIIGGLRNQMRPDSNTEERVKYKSELL